MGCLVVISVVYASTIKAPENDIYKRVSIGTELPKETMQSPTQSRKTHPIRASHQISEVSLGQYLGQKKSPLAEYASQLSASPYWSTIIAICTIEEYSCSVNPYGSNNFWGLMAHGQIIKYVSISAGIDAINAFLERADRNGRTTIESFRGWYCASACTNWESVVISTKLKLEALE